MPENSNHREVDYRIGDGAVERRGAPKGPSSRTLFGDCSASRDRSLEHEPERELQVAHLVLGRGAGNLPGVGPRVPRDADGVVRLSEVHVVEDVDDLHPELQVGRPASAEPLEERGVDVPEPGTGEGVALHVAEGPLSRTAERAPRDADGRRVEPLVLRLRPGRIPDEVRTA